MFIYLAIKRYEELWRVEDRAQSERLKSVRVQDDTKTVRQRIRQNPLWEKRSCPECRTYRPNQCRASSGTVNIWQRTCSQIDTPLLLLWGLSDGHGASVIGTPRTDTKISSSWTRKSSPSRSSTITRTTKFKLKRPVRWRKTFRRCRVAITLLRHSLGGVVPSGGDTSSSCKRRVKLVSGYIKRTCYKSCVTS